jgi:ATP-dependent DNA helicase RecG
MNEKKVYEFVRRELARGKQAYFVYPLIEQSERAYLKDAESMYQRLKAKVFPDFPMALIHSRIREEEKREAMAAFTGEKISVLVATSVVEVGVDVPNATCMVVEHAELFGLSALHQLRGRVGRGTDQAYCFLVYSDKLTEEGKQRLMVMLENNDGFAIAEEDLRIRGPGEIAGKAQSGFLRLTIADPVRDQDALIRAREDAFAILESDPGFIEQTHMKLRALARRAEI